MRLIRKFLREAKTPLLILAIIGCLYALAAVGLVPLPTELLRALAARLARGEWLFVAACSILENTVGFNGYFPGAFVILFAMASTHGNVPAASRVFYAICSGAFVGQHLSYLFGRILVDRDRRNNHNTISILLAIGLFWHPQLGSAYSFSAGRQPISYGRFLIILAAAWSPWNVFWGILMYNLGRVPIDARSFLGIFAVYLILWLIWALVRAARPSARDQT